MKKLIRYLISIAILVLVAGSSCDNGEEFTYTSIEGLFSCSENSAHSGYKKYITEIDKVNNETSQYIILNFHNTGENEFLYAELIADTLYIRNQTIGSMFFNGKGAVSDDYKKISFWYETDDGVTILDYAANFER